MLIAVGELNPSRLLAAMDPVLRVKAGEHYPPLLLSVGFADALVAPWNSGKFAATVMAASPSTPVWIRTEQGAGHVATTNSANAQKYADYFAWAEAMLSPESAR